MQNGLAHQVLWILDLCVTVKLIPVAVRVLEPGAKARVRPQCVLWPEHLAAVLCDHFQYLGDVLDGYRKAGAGVRGDELAVEAAADVARFENGKGVAVV